MKFEQIHRLEWSLDGINVKFADFDNCTLVMQVLSPCSKEIHTEIRMHQGCTICNLLSKGSELHTCIRVATHVHIHIQSEHMLHMCMNAAKCQLL